MIGAIHLLLIPVDHIASVDRLDSRNLEMLVEMNSTAHALIDSSNTWVLGFHVPPFISVDHLHLHLIKRPFKNFWRSLKYIETNGNWFVGLENVIQSCRNKSFSGYELCFLSE